MKKLIYIFLSILILVLSLSFYIQILSIGKAEKAQALVALESKLGEGETFEVERLESW